MLSLPRNKLDEAAQQFRQVIALDPENYYVI